MKRLLKANLKTFYYATYKGVEMLKDEHGRSTGEPSVIYNEPVKCKGNISAARGEADIAVFGVDLPYTHAIALAGIDTEISETSVLWLHNDITQPHDAIVLRVAKSLNSTLLAIQQVNVRRTT